MAGGGDPVTPNSGRIWLGSNPGMSNRKVRWPSTATAILVLSGGVTLPFSSDSSYSPGGRRNAAGVVSVSGGVVPVDDRAVTRAHGCASMRMSTEGAHSALLKLNDPS